MRTLRSRWLAVLPALGALAVAAACGGGGGGDGTAGADGGEGGVVGEPPASSTVTEPPAPVPPPPGDGSADGAPDGAGDGGDAGADGGDADGGDAGPLSPSYVDFDVNHVLVTGQSNSVGNGADAVLTAAQPYGNLMFDVGPMAMAPCDGEACYGYEAPVAFAPLVEGDAYFDYAVETPANGLADEITSLATTRYGLAKHDVLVSIHGRSGTTYWCLRKGGCNYKPMTALVAFDQGMMEVASAKALAAAAGKSYVVRAVVAIHGEADQTGYSFDTPEFPNDGSDGAPGALADYTDALLEWQKDYEAGVKAITGQAEPVPLFVTGLSGWNDARYSKVAQMQLAAHAKSGGKVVLVGPGYPLSFSNDCIHYDSDGERRLGEYVAKVYAKVVLGGQTWEPVRPKTVTIAGAVITAKMFVPSPPLVLDTTRVTDPGSFGFEYTDDSGAPPAIASVAVTAPDTVTITLSEAPAAGAANRRLLYAQNQTPGTCIGPGTVLAGGARGNLRDSDATPSKYGYDLFDWAVPFDVPLP
jgi:hypothetical protein